MIRQAPEPTETPRHQRHHHAPGAVARASDAVIVVFLVFAVLTFLASVGGQARVSDSVQPTGTVERVDQP